MFQIFFLVSFKEKSFYPPEKSFYYRNSKAWRKRERREKALVERLKGNRKNLGFPDC